VRGGWRHVEDMPPAWAPGGGIKEAIAAVGATPTPNPSPVVPKARLRRDGEGSPVEIAAPLISV